ncbi:MAG: flavodoxin domain-containing protein, partial [Candidatus Microthrix sp.]|nr:flavodoxin domain-containing protein [Candidatus Microthrix sp.]
MIMTVLVGYASAYGSTKGIASRVGEHLRAAGFEVDVHPVDEIDAVNAYEAVIIGSAIHNQKWLPSGDEFMRAHAEALA